jgi:excisionase family DNA binding protein
MSDILLKAAEAGRLLGLSARKVYALAEAGILPCYRFGAAVRFAPADVEAYRESCRSTSTERTSAGAISSTVTLPVSGTGLADYFRRAGLAPKPKSTTTKRTPASKPLRLVSQSSAT